MQIIQTAYAEVNFGNASVNPVAKFSSISVFTDILIPLFMIGGGLLTLIMLLYAAFMYLTSEGTPEKIKKAQAVLTYSLMGIFLIVLSFVITKIVGYIFHVTMPL